MPACPAPGYWAMWSMARTRGCGACWNAVGSRTCSRCAPTTACASGTRTGCGRPAEELGDALADGAWGTHPAREGSKGLRLYDWARIALPSACDPAFEHWLLIRRSRKEPGKRAYYLVFAPAGVTLAEHAADEMQPAHFDVEKAEPAIAPVLPVPEREAGDAHCVSH